MWSWFKMLLGLGLLGLAVFFCACGYTFNHKLSDRFNHSKGIYVPIFFNGTDQVGAEMPFTNALIRKLLSHGEHIVYSQGESGLILKGKILGISHTTGSKLDLSDSKGVYNYNIVPDQIGISASIQLVLLETATMKTLWTQTYPGFIWRAAPRDRLSDKAAPSSFGLITQSIVEASYADIARDFASAAYDGMVEPYYGKKKDGNDSRTGF